METFIHEMGKYVGPKSGTGKILSIDGEPYYMNPGLSEYFDYGIVQPIIQTATATFKAVLTRRLM